MGSFLSSIKRVFREVEFWQFRHDFYKRFSFYTTESESELNEIYRLRYKVYCEEYGYLDKEKYKNGMETDEWDAHSEHFVIRDNRGHIAATARLILGSNLGLPIEKHFDLDISLSNYPHENIGEISRLIVAREHRRHHLLFVLIKGIYLYVKQRKVQYVFSVMDDRLYPMIKAFGIPYRRIGKPSLYQGYTYPCIVDVSELEEQLKTENPRLLKYLMDGLMTYDQKNNKYTIS